MLSLHPDWVVERKLKRYRAGVCCSHWIWRFDNARLFPLHIGNAKWNNNFWIEWRRTLFCHYTIEIYIQQGIIHCLCMHEYTLVLVSEFATNPYCWVYDIISEYRTFQFNFSNFISYAYHTALPFSCPHSYLAAICGEPANMLFEWQYNMWQYVYCPLSHHRIF